MTSQQSPDRDASTTADRRGRAGGWSGRRSPPPVLRAVGYAAAAWCLGFAAVSAWQLTAGPIGQPEAGQQYGAYASALAIASVLAGVLKLAGAALALAAVTGQRRMRTVGQGVQPAGGIGGGWSWLTALDWRR